jgi:hypothetical protein
MLTGRQEGVHPIYTVGATSSSLRKVREMKMVLLKIGVFIHLPIVQ